MKRRIEFLRKMRPIAAVAIWMGAMWIAGGTASYAAGGQIEGKETSMTAETEPAIAGYQKVLYRDSGDEIAIIGEGIQSVKYSSTNRDVAVVSDFGVVSGVEEGKADIVAEVQYKEGEETKTKKLSYELKVIDNFTNYFDVLNGDVKGLTEKGKTLKEMYIPDYCNLIKVKSANWKKILCRNAVVEKVFLSDYMEYFLEDGIANGMDAPQKLREITLGKNLIVFGNINGASALEKFIVHPENKNFEEVDQVLFNQSTLVCYPMAKKDAAYTVPAHVEYIHKYAFSGTRNLAKISLPKGLDSIEQYAFINAGLTEIEIPAKASLSVDSFVDCPRLQKVLLPEVIHEWDVIFKNCPALKTVTVPNTAKYVFGRCFVNCPALTDFQVSPGASDYQVEDGVLLKKSTRELVAYPMGRKDAGYVMPKGIKKIGIGGFYGAANLKEVKLDDALTVIDYDAFANCSSLVKVRLPKRVKKIVYHSGWEESGMFWGCTSLKEIAVDSQNKYFSSAKGILYNKSGKTLYRYPQAKKGSKFTVPKKVTTIANSAISQTRYLKKVAMGNGVKTIEKRAFKDGKALKQVALSSKLTKLNAGSFKNCKKLAKVVLPNGIAAVNGELFAGCTSLKEVVLGKNIKNIKYQAFYDCKNLQKIVFKGKKWLGMTYNRKLSDNDFYCPFYLAGSKKYSRLTVQIPKCTKSQKKKCKKVLWGNGLHKNAKIKFANK